MLLCATTFSARRKATSIRGFPAEPCKKVEVTMTILRHDPAYLHYTPHQRLLYIHQRHVLFNPLRERSSKAPQPPTQEHSHTPRWLFLKSAPVTMGIEAYAVYRSQTTLRLWGDPAGAFNCSRNSGGLSVLAHLMNNPVRGFKTSARATDTS